MFGRLDNAKPDGEKTVIAPMKLPPGMENRPPLPGETGREKDAKGLPMMKPALGVNTNMLFAEKIRDPDDRFERVENAVQEMRSDYDAMLPAMLRLVAVEKDINNLVGQLETLLKNDGQDVAQDLAPAKVEPVAIETTMPPPAAAEAEEKTAEVVKPVSAPPPAVPEAIPAPTLPPQATPPPATPPVQLAKSATGSVKGLGLRIGAHPDFARIVLDLSATSSFKADLDSNEKILIVSLPDVQWTGAMNGSGNHPLVQSWNVTPGQNGAGTLVSFQLLGNTKIKTQTTLSNPARVVIDLASQ